MKPQEFLTLVRGSDLIESLSQDTYRLSNRARTRETISKRLPELEHHLGESSLAFVSTHSEPTIETITIDAYVEKEDSAYHLTIHLVPHRAVIDIFASRISKEYEMLSVNITVVEKEKQQVVDYILNHSSYRLYFVTGDLEIREY